MSPPAPDDTVLHAVQTLYAEQDRKLDELSARVERYCEEREKEAEAIRSDVRELARAIRGDDPSGGQSLFARFQEVKHSLETEQQECRTDRKALGERLIVVEAKVKDGHVEGVRGLWSLAASVVALIGTVALAVAAFFKGGGAKP